MAQMVAVTAAIAHLGGLRCVSGCGSLPRAAEGCGGLKRAGACQMRVRRVHQAHELTKSSVDEVHKSFLIGEKTLREYFRQNELLLRRTLHTFLIIVGSRERRRPRAICARVSNGVVEVCLGPVLGV